MQSHLAKKGDKNLISKVKLDLNLNKNVSCLKQINVKLILYLIHN
jgi:hypothetical protein